jgi:hypothetical protein
LKPEVEVALVDHSVEFFGMFSLLALIIIYRAEKQVKRKPPFRETGLKPPPARLVRTGIDPRRS